MTRTFIALHVILLMFLTSYIKCISHNVACNQLISGHAVLHPIDVVRVAYYSQHMFPPALRGPMSNRCVELAVSRIASWLTLSLTALA